MPIHPYLRELSQLKSFSQRRSMTGRDQVLHRVTFDSLPLEIQDEIFFCCLPPFPRFSIKEAPIVLARVCSTWRSIALSTPRLWSSFEVEIQGSGASGLLHDTRLMYRMKLWLERSSYCPLSIKLVYHPLGRVSDDRSAQFLVALAPESRRWRNAHFILPATSIAQLHSFPPNSFPTLRSLTLNVTGQRSSPSEPRLNLSVMNIPWCQLTTLDLHFDPSNSLTLNNGLDVLSKTVNLKHGILRLICTWDGRFIHRDKLSLPALETLQLVVEGSGFLDRPEACLMQFLNLLCLPKLGLLHLGWLVNSYIEYNWSFARSDFLAFLRASSQTLHQLTMTYLPISEDELLECLSLVPGLTHLTVRFALNEGANDPITNRFLVACTMPSSTVSGGIIAHGRQVHTETSLLPRLEHLHLQCHGALYTNATLLTLIQSRWKVFSQGNDSHQAAWRSLKSFGFLSMKLVPSEVEKRVKVWQEEGLEIDIQCLVIR